MMTKPHCQEALCRAYIQAVAGVCGMTCSWRDFDYGIDMTINEVTCRARRFIEAGWKLDVQAKSTTLARYGEDCVHYDLEVKTYDDLRDHCVMVPRVLVLLVLPEDESQWLSWSSEELLLRRCCYWCSFREAAAVETKGSTRVTIPTTQEFSPDGLRVLMQRIRAGENP